MNTEQITRSEFEKFRFCRRYWDENGGAIDKRPYWDEIGTEQTGKQQRVYINATWFPSWEKFSIEADRALTAAVVEYDAFHGRYVKSGTSYHISEKPHYLVEEMTWPNIGLYNIWINALCPDREQFEATLAEAKEKIESMKSGEIKPGFRVASLFDRKPDMLRYPSEWCQTTDNTVGALLARKGIK